MVVYLPQLPPLAKQINKNIITDFPGTIHIQKMDYIKAISFNVKAIRYRLQANF